MLSQKFIDMTSQKSEIRNIAEYGAKRAAEIGYENVFDYSLGNPSVPAPDCVKEVLIELAQNMSPVALHSYSPSLGIMSVKQDIAESLNRRFDMNYQGKNIFPVSGAAAAIAHAVRAVTVPEDEVITFAPHFPEYMPYINSSGAQLKVVPADISNFQINFEEFEKMLNPKVMAILINTPNNPSGIVYSTETILKLTEILANKEKEYGHDIYIISDEPYREIIFGGVDAPFVSKYYANTIVCYSFSKSLSLPGERIGYIAVNPGCKDADLIVDMCGQISRGIGHNCPSSMMQFAVAKCIDETSDISVYEENKNILYRELTRMGLDIVEPGGIFYIFPKALEEDARSFCQKALKYDLLLVPSDSFGVPGHFRMAYCVPTEKVLRSIPVFKKFVKEQYGK